MSAAPGAWHGVLGDAQARVTVSLGDSRMRMADMLKLGRGAVVELDREVDEPVDVYVSGVLVARAEIEHDGNSLGLRIVEIVRRGAGRHIGK